MSDIIISPSILSADFANLERDIKLHILGLQTREQEQQQKKTDASHIFKVCLFIQRKEKIR